MVIERFKDAHPEAVGARFRELGRLIPADSGIEYIASWMTPDGTRCYQVMEAPSRASLQGWIDAWSDLVDFEVIAVQTSADFWRRRAEG